MKVSSSKNSPKLRADRANRSLDVVSVLGFSHDLLLVEILISRGKILVEAP